jgi:hypothetical protein
MVERRNVIMSIKGGELALRVLGGVFEFFFYVFELFLALLYHFGLVCHFSCLLLVIQLFLLLDNLLEIFCFWSSSCVLWCLEF